MKLLTIDEENFNHYKKPSMVLGFPKCAFKCVGCQNKSLAKEKSRFFKIKDIYSKYIDNKITSAVVLAGLEPFDSFWDLIKFVIYFRRHNDDDIVIYTGYKNKEIRKKIFILKFIPNIIVKFGRYIPGSQKHKDEILGIELASSNQYGVKIS